MAVSEEVPVSGAQQRSFQPRGEVIKAEREAGREASFSQEALSAVNQGRVGTALPSLRIMVTETWLQGTVTHICADRQTQGGHGGQGMCWHLASLGSLPAAQLHKAWPRLAWAWVLVLLSIVGPSESHSL